MALVDILAQAGDGQDFILEIPAGNSAFVPIDVLLGSDGALLTAEIRNGNIFIMND